jgi:hypothetical protein
MKRSSPGLTVNRGRRRFLAGTAGLLALPYLESLTKTARANFAPTPGMPSRLLVLMHGHGTIMEEFVPRAGFVQGEVLRPVADAGLAHKMLVVTGVNSKTQSGHAGTPSLLTCVPTRANQFGVTHATGPSIDHVIARHMQGGGLPRRLDLGLHDQSTNPAASSLSGDHERVFWSGDNANIPALIHPSAAFARAFPADPNAGEDTAVAAARQARRRSVLDGALAEFNRLRSRVSAADQQRLDRHAETLHELEQTLEVPAADQTCAAAAPPTPADHRRAGESLVDILALAAACNVADVGTFKFFDVQEAGWGHLTHPDLQGTFAGENYHGAWHRASDQRLASARRAFTAVNRFYGQLFARLLQRLDEIDEGDGTALDHTMVMWISDFGHGGGHSSDNLPIVIAGNAGGAALGRHVNYAANPADPWGDSGQPGNHNLCVTLQQAFGVPADRFGNYQDVRQPVGAGPLTL